MASQVSEAVVSEAPATTTATSKFRWVVVALLFSATTINYIDRQVLGLLAPLLQKTLHWSEKDYADITISFSLAYAIGFLIAGPLMDRVGVKKGYAGAILVWSLAAMSHALATGKLSFQMARAALGLGESGNFPGAIKAVAEWFPKRERALATGIFNAGSNIGAIITPLTIPYVAVHFGWRYAFLCTGGLSTIWLVVWLLVYESPEKHNRVSKSELAHIQSDAARRRQARSAGVKSLRHRQAWAFILGKGTHRSSLVVLPLLAAEIPRQTVSRKVCRSLGADHRDLPGRRHRLRVRRLPVGCHHQARRNGKSGGARPRCSSRRASSCQR